MVARLEHFAGMLVKRTASCVRNNPTQAKRRLEWGTQAFVAGEEALSFSAAFCRRFFISNNSPCFGLSGVVADPIHPLRVISSS